MINAEGEIVLENVLLVVADAVVAAAAATDEVLLRNEFESIICVYFTEKNEMNGKRKKDVGENWRKLKV